jgi:hypothetical protein
MNITSDEENFGDQTNVSLARPSIKIGNLDSPIT